MDRNVYLRMSEQDSQHWWFVARRQILADQIAALDLGADARVLEAGCGPGGNLEMLSRFGNLAAFELDDQARQVASVRSGVDVDSGALPDQISYPAETFDLVAAFDVVEHIERDRESVRSMAELLRPGGRLMISVPAYQWLWSRHDERHHHWRRYTRQEIEALIQEAGLRIEKSTHFNTLLFPLIMLVRFFKNLLGIADRPDDRTPGPMVNGLLRRIFAAERYWLRHGSFPVGVSILCIACKD
ncbi:MAG: class I SAM-dependent methyltransferase [Paracoccaceae bacterium]|nr:class I SAM-dependent methyltransferase [Paracoccaceae bacterium]